MKNGFLTLAFTLLTLFLHAQGAFQKIIGDLWVEIPEINDMLLCSDGGYLLSGSNKIIKTDSAGGLLWAKSLNTLGGYEIRSSGEIPGEGYFVLLTEFSSNAILAKLTLSGDLTWVKKYNNGLNSFSYYPYIKSTIKRMENGEFVISLSLWNYIYAMKADEDGNFLWGRAFSSDSTKNPGFDCIGTSDGGILLSGKASSDVQLIKVNSSGQLQWAKRYQNNDALYNRAYSIINTSDGNYIIAGLQEETLYHKKCGFIMKMDSAGTILWHRKYLIQPSKDFYFTSVHELSNGNLLIGGETETGRAVIVFTDANGEIIRSNYFGQDGNYGGSPVIRKSLNGVLLNVFTTDSANTHYINVFSKSSEMDMSWCGLEDMQLTYQTGTFSPTITSDVISFFKGSQGTVSLTVSPYTTLTATNYCTSAAISETEQPKALTISPNPASSFLTISLSTPTTATARLINTLGQTVKELAIDNGQLTINVSALPSGFYFLQVQHGGKMLMEKVMIN